MEKCKVLHIAPGFKYGGIESRLVDWYSRMDKSLVHFDVVKVTPDESNPLVDKLESLGAKVYSIPPLGVRTWKKHFSAMRKIIISGNYDVIHSHSLAYGFFPMLLGKKLGIKKRILHSRTTSLNPGDKHILISKFLSKLAIPLATDYFACSEEAGEWAFGKNKKAKIIKNGIVLENFIFSQEERDYLRKELCLDEAKVVGYIGRFSTQKNLIFLIDSFRIATEKESRLKLMLIGDGPEYEKIVNYSKECGLKDRIIFLGRKDDVNIWYNAMDAFVLPSLFEGFGTVAIEAQTNGLPCLVSTGVPYSTKVLETIKYLPIDNPQVWADEMLFSLSNSRDNNAADKVKMAGYNYVDTVEFLQKYYLI